MYVVFFFLLPPLVQASLKAKLSSSPLDTCSTCKLVAQVLKGFIDNNKTEVHSVCVYIVVPLAVYNQLQSRADVVTANKVIVTFLSSPHPTCVQTEAEDEVKKLCNLLPAISSEVHLQLMK